MPLDRSVAGGKDASIFLPRLFRHIYAPNCDRIIGVSDAMADEIRRCVRKKDVEKVESIPNPVLNDVFYDRAKQALSAEIPKGKLILGLGRLSHQKGFDILIRALARLPQHYVLLILGDGPDREALKALAKSLNVGSRCNFGGFTLNPLPFVKHADIFALPSRFEGLPTALIEAVALDTPIVAADCKFGPRQILRDGELGHLVPVGDPDALCVAMAADNTRPSVRNKALYNRHLEHYASDNAIRRYLNACDFASHG